MMLTWWCVVEHVFGTLHFARTRTAYSRLMICVAIPFDPYGDIHSVLFDVFRPHVPWSPLLYRYDIVTYLVILLAVIFPRPCYSTISFVDRCHHSIRSPLQWCWPHPYVFSFCPLPVPTCYLIPWCPPGYRSSVTWPRRANYLMLSLSLLTSVMNWKVTFLVTLMIRPFWWWKSLIFPFCDPTTLYDDTGDDDDTLFGYSLMMMEVTGPIRLFDDDDRRCSVPVCPINDPWWPFHILLFDDAFVPTLHDGGIGLMMMMIIPDDDDDIARRATVWWTLTVWWQ